MQKAESISKGKNLVVLLPKKESRSQLTVVDDVSEDGEPKSSMNWLKQGSLKSVKFALAILRGVLFAMFIPSPIDEHINEVRNKSRMFGGF